VPTEIPSLYTVTATMIFHVVTNFLIKTFKGEPKSWGLKGNLLHSPFNILVQKIIFGIIQAKNPCKE